MRALSVADPPAVGGMYISNARPTIGRRAEVLAVEPSRVQIQFEGGRASWMLLRNFWHRFDRPKCPNCCGDRREHGHGLWSCPTCEHVGSDSDRKAA